MCLQFFLSYNIDSLYYTLKIKLTISRVCLSYNTYSIPLIMCQATWHATICLLSDLTHCHVSMSGYMTFHNVPVTSRNTPTRDFVNWWRSQLFLILYSTRHRSDPLWLLYLIIKPNLTVELFVFNLFVEGSCWLSSLIRVGPGIVKWRPRFQFVRQTRKSCLRIWHARDINHGILHLPPVNVILNYYQQMPLF